MDGLGTVRMPRLEEKRMEVLSRVDVIIVLSGRGCLDRALVMTLIDSGVGRREALCRTMTRSACRNARSVIQVFVARLHAQSQICSVG